MGIKKIEKKNNKLEKKKLDKKIFKRIKDKFREYYKVLFWLIFIYIAAYLFWAFALAPAITKLIRNQRWDKENWLLVIFVILFQGGLFCLDGWVTSLLKSPFNQMCYTINKVEEIDDKRKDYIITKATESNEHCKETLKKFGVLAISGELIRVFIEKGDVIDTVKYGTHAAWFNLSYLIPLSFAALAIFQIRREINKISKSFR